MGLFVRMKEGTNDQNNIVARDFNDDLIPKEKRGGNIIYDPFRDRMEDLISDWDLIYILPRKT